MTEVSCTGFELSYTSRRSRIRQGGIPLPIGRIHRPSKTELPAANGHTDPIAMLSEFGTVFIFFLLGIIFVAGGLVTNWLLRPSRPTREKLLIYECGEDSPEHAHIRFNIRFYVIALVFLLFDLEFVMLFPWATVFGAIGHVAFWLGTVFLLVLIVGDVYLWRKGDLDWVIPRPVVPRLESLITHQKPRFRPSSEAVHASASEPSEPA